MSKLGEHFDQITASDELKNSVKNRIEQDLSQSKSKQDLDETKSAQIYTAKLSNNSYEKQKHSSQQKAAPNKKYVRRLCLAVVSLFLITVLAYPTYIIAHNLSLNIGYDFSAARQVKSESQLSSIVGANYKSQTMEFFSKSFSSNVDMAVDSAESNMAPSYSTTNVQVEGMDEGDIVKNDGEYIYRLSPSGFSIVKADNGSLSRICQIPIEKFSPQEMYVRDNKLILIGGAYSSLPAYLRNGLIEGNLACFYYHTSVEIRIYDISDKANPVEERYFQIEGNYHTSRVSESDGKLYFLVNYYNYNYYYYNTFESDAENKEWSRPYFREEKDAVPAPLPLEEIYYFKRVPGSSYMIIGAIDLENTDGKVQKRAYLGSTSVTYVSGEHIYTGSSQPRYTLFGDLKEIVTYIAKFSLQGLDYLAGNTVQGTIKDRYCMDEYQGNLRVATSYTDYNSITGLVSNGANAVYAFDSNMKKLDSITGIAKGESIDSATFSGDKGYISTSVQLIDPLFIIDFSNPTNLSISEGLKEDGINSYLKAIEDTNYVIGIGEDTNSNSTAWNSVSGIKIQLYDMSGEEAVSVAKLTIDGDCSYAEVLSNPKALLYMYDKQTKKGIIGFAATKAGNYSYAYSYNYDYALRQQGFYLYSFDAEAGTLSFEGLLSNFDTTKDIFRYSYDAYSWEWHYDMYLKFVDRSIVIGDYIYTVSDTIITSYQLSDLTKLQTLDDKQSTAQTETNSSNNENVA